MKCLVLVLAIMTMACSFCLAAADSSLPPPVAIQGGVTSVDDIGYYTVSYRYFDGRTGQEPLGWTGNFEASTGISAIPSGTQHGKTAFLLHPIWRGGTGDTDQTYRLMLPKAASIELSVSIAMRDDAVGKSDGVTFRVRVNGQTLLDQNKTDINWTDYTFDLSPYAGQTITLVFESNPGPKHDPSFDFGLWGDRQLVVRGAPTRITTASNLPEPDLKVPTQGWGSAAPTRFTSEPNDNIRALLAMSPSDLLTGMSFKIVPGTKAAAATIPFGNGGYLDLVAPDGHIVPSSSTEVHTVVTQTAGASGAIRRTASYTLDGRTIHVMADIDRYDGSCVRVRIRSSDPFIAAVHAGSIGPTPMRRSIIVPYYGTVSFDPDTRLFFNVFYDYALSHGSSQSGDATEYAPLTDGTRNTLDETIYYALSPHIGDVLPTPINAPSPYRQAMGDVAVLDYWGGDASKFADFLRELSTYGLTHFLTIVHDWQHGGYDQQLPAVLPANANIGGNAGLLTLTSTARSLGERVALHENYVDFYPNGPLYDRDDIAVTPDGQLIPAWSFPGHVSFLMTPVEMHKYAAKITPLVHQQIGTNASYLDVHSAIVPWVHTDASATRIGAGMYVTCIDAQKSLWQYMRDVHGGPVLGEGSAHWYWSGMLDGVEAQFGQGVPGNAGETAPLFVDFDLLKIHPRQMNHGMGYLERWLNPTSTGPLTQSQIDEYRMQEIAYGHSAFVSTKDDTMALPFVWEESNLVLPVASRYATAKVSAISYSVEGRMLATDHAIAAGAHFDQVRVAYDNGLNIYANGRNEDWTVRAVGDRFTLPEYGWLATGPQILAYTALRGGHTVSFAQTPDSIYANTRQLKPIDYGYAAPRVLSFKQTGPRAFDIAFGFDVRSKIPSGEVVFTHLVSTANSANEGIVAQFGSGVFEDPETWAVGALIAGGIIHAILPDTLADGSYDIRTGLYNPSSGVRLKLTGDDDGSSRYTLGRLVVGDGGSVVTFTSDPATEPAARRATLELTDFGVLATNGSVRMTRRTSGTWTLTPMPRDTPFTVKLDGIRIDSKWRRIRAVAVDENGTTIGPVKVLPIAAGLSVLQVDLPSSGVAYRLQTAE